MSEHQGEVRREGDAGRQPQQGPRPKADDPGRRSRKRVRIAIGVSLALAAAFLWWQNARKFEDTEDAQIDGYITAVSSRVPGTVLRVMVEDNQQVKQGDPLIELDTADLQVALAQARAAVAQA